MPRAPRKKRLLNPLKSQLLFKEAPFNGAKHDYGPQHHSAILPRSFMSDKHRRERGQCASSWVSPQFTSLETSNVTRGSRGMRKKRLSNKASVSCLPPATKTLRCRYTTLPFQPSTGCENIHHSQTKNKTERAGEVQETPKTTHFPQKDSKQRTITSAVCTSLNQKKVLGSETPVLSKIGRAITIDLIHSPNTSSLLDPPNVETPEMPRCSSAASPSSVRHLLFSPNHPRSPPRTENACVLVPDTPEKDYGLRVTWRRRKGLMNLLIDKGKLLLRDTQVTNEWI